MRPLFVRLSFIMRLLSLRRYVSSIYMYATERERESRISVLSVWLDDDDEDDNISKNYSHYLKMLKIMIKKTKISSSSLLIKMFSEIIRSEYSNLYQCTQIINIR